MDWAILTKPTIVAAILCLCASCAVRPTAFSASELDAGARYNMSLLTRSQESVMEPISLYQAMARALKYNLDLRVKDRQAQLANAKLNLSHYDLLPDIVANSGYASRDNLYASQSLNLSTGAIDASSSSSQDRQQFSKDLSFSWSVLDFGLSYIRAKQTADRYLIARELSRTTSHKLLEEVRTTYWKAQAYDRSLERLARLERRAKRAISNSRSMSASQQISRFDALVAERELIKIQQAVKILQKDYNSAKTVLAKLMNLRPGTPFKLMQSKKTDFPSELRITHDEMMYLAARDRPEIRELMYLQRINMQEVKAAMLEILPGLNVYATSNWDSNSFLLNNSWSTWGAAASWSLLKLFQYPAKKQTIEAQQEIYRSRALAMTMSVITQVHISRLNYASAIKEYSIAKDYQSVQRRLIKQMRIEAGASRVSEHELLLEEMNTLISEMKSDIAYAQLQSAYANMVVSIGADPYAVINRGWNLEKIAETLRKAGTISDLSNPFTGPQVLPTVRRQS